MYWCENAALKKKETAEFVFFINGGKKQSFQKAFSTNCSDYALFCLVKLDRDHLFGADAFELVFHDWELLQWQTSEKQKDE